MEENFDHTGNYVLQEKIYVVYCNEVKITGIVTEDYVKMHKEVVILAAGQENSITVVLEND